MSIQNGNFGLVSTSTEGSSSEYFTQVSEPWHVGLLFHLGMYRTLLKTEWIFFFLQIPSMDVDLRNPCDMSYIFSGAYAPLSCKLVDQVSIDIVFIQNTWDRWD